MIWISPHSHSKPHPISKLIFPFEMSRQNRYTKQISPQYNSASCGIIKTWNLILSHETMELLIKIKSPDKCVRMHEVALALALPSLIPARIYYMVEGRPLRGSIRLTICSRQNAKKARFHLWRYFISRHKLWCCKTTIFFWLYRIGMKYEITRKFVPY